MNLVSFHHPDLSLPVIRRRVGDELLYLVATFGQLVATRGWSAIAGQGPRRESYISAAYRLAKAGLITGTRRGSRHPELELTETGRARLPTLCRPRGLWKKKWQGIWYVLSYDVPEKQRAYRDALRGFLKRMRMGYLHRSVWVSPHDIRPEYADLAQAASVDEYAFLLEAKTVLGRPARDIVESAWDWDSLYEGQRWYRDVYSENLSRAVQNTFSSEELATLAREEISAYLTVMENDPLLPVELWPSDYIGHKVYDLHKQLVHVIAKII